MPTRDDPSLPPDYSIVETAAGPPSFPKHGQDVSLQLLNVHDASPAAACSLWHTNTPQLTGEKPGIIGHFEATATDAGALLLDYAARRLRALGCTIAIGPMDGNTWCRYRLITGRGQQPTFFLEPDNPDEWPAAFTSAGFHSLAEYYSAEVTDLALTDDRTVRVKSRLSAAGVSIREVHLDSFADDLRRVHKLSLQSFRDNFLYTDISLDEFLAQYLPIQKYILPEFVLLAEHNGQTVGFAFAVPDLAQAHRGETVDTVILKTLAVAPGRTYAGLGALLLERIHQSASAKGFRRVVHALMHEKNQSLNLSTRTAVPFRRYTLFAKKLT